MAAPRAWSLPEVALVAAGVLLLLWQPTFYLSDEHAQSLGHRSLADGDVLTTEASPGYAPFMDHASTHGSLRALEEGPVRMPGSDLENVLGLPMRGILLVLAMPLGFGTALGAVAASGVGGAAWAALRRRVGDRSATWSGGAVASVLFLGAAVRTQAFPADPWLDVASLQLATIAWTAVAAALWFDLVRRERGTGLAWVAAGLWLLGTPVLFWALNIKYHGLALALATAAIWAYRDGHRTPPLRTLLAASLVGLAFWNHPPSGGLLGAALVVAALPGLRDGRRFLPRVGAGLAGLAWGLVPVMLWRSLTTTGPAGAQGIFAAAVWNDPAGALDTLWQTYVWTEWWDVSEAMSMLTWAPWLLFGLVTLARRELRARVGPLWPAAALYAVVPVLLIGSRMLDIGAGVDMRHHVTAWPWLLLLAWPAIAERLRGRPAAWWGGQVAAAAAVGMATLLVVNLLWHKATGVDFIQMGYGFEGTWMHRYGGTALAAALAAWLAVGRWVRVRWPGATDRVLDPLLAWSLAASVSLGIWLRLAAAQSRSANNVPFVAWPVDLLSRALQWIGYSY